MSPANFNAKTVAESCIRSIEGALHKRSSLTFSSEPTFRERTIIEYKSRMRVFGMELFNGPCYISTVNYYLSEADKDERNPCGAFVLYIEEGCAARLLKALGYKGFNEDDDASMAAACGEACEMFADEYRGELIPLGYKDLIVSKSKNYHNNVLEGIEFSYDQYVKCETSFNLWRQKAFVVDITLKPV